MYILSIGTFRLLKTTLSDMSLCIWALATYLLWYVDWNLERHSSKISRNHAPLRQSCIYTAQIIWPVTIWGTAETVIYMKELRRKDIMSSLAEVYGWYFLRREEGFRRYVLNCHSRLVFTARYELRPIGLILDFKLKRLEKSFHWSNCKVLQTVL